MVIHGRVVDAAGRRVAGAAVYVVTSPRPVPDIAQLSDDQGEFAIAAPIAGRYLIGARTDAATGEVAVDVGVSDVDARILLTATA